MNTVDRVQKQQMKRRGVISKNDDKIESLLAKFNAIEDKIEESMIIP